MKKAQLFFATNRNHIGKDRWHPAGYGAKFSADGHENLRFGELALDCESTIVDKFTGKKYADGRIGDGEGLAKYLTKQAAKAKITAYKDSSVNAKAPIDIGKNSSSVFFQNIKKIMMQCNDVLIYIHGYNVSWEEAVGSALSLQFMLNAQRGEAEKSVLVVLFSWPSNGSMMPFAAYRSDRADARDAGKAVGRAILKMKDFLQTLKSDAKSEEEVLCDQEIHLLCHSMGNYLLQKGLDSKVIGYAGTSVLPRIFKHIFLCAADVEDNVMEGEGAMARLHEMAAHVTIYFNQGDVAMSTSKYTKNAAARLGQVGNAHPALVHNKVHQVDCSEVVHGFVEHSYYLWATVNRDIWQSIEGLSFGHETRNRKASAQNREWVLT